MDDNVSIALATYNGERFILEQLESYAKQTLLPAEVVISDDGSTDRTLQIVDEFTLRAPFQVRVFKNEKNLGPRDNFIRAATLCTSRYVAYSDQDDVWLPEKLERCMGRIAQDRSVLAIHQAYVADAALNTSTLLSQGITHSTVIPPLGIQPLPGVGFGFTMVFERRLLTLVEKHLWPRQPYLFPDQGVSHDLWVYVLASVFGSTSHIAEPLALYRQHAHNLVGMQSPSYKARILEKLTIPLWHYRWRRDFSAECARAFAEAAPSLNETEKAMAEVGAARYQSIASAVSKRLVIYESNSFHERLHQFRNLRDSGAYGQVLSRSSQVRDFASGVLRLRLLEKER